MALQNFVEGGPPVIHAAWLNQVDQIIQQINITPQGNLIIGPPQSGVALTVIAAAAGGAALSLNTVTANISPYLQFAPGGGFQGLIGLAATAGDLCQGSLAGDVCVLSGSNIHLSPSSGSPQGQLVIAGKPAAVPSDRTLLTQTISGDARLGVAALGPSGNAQLNLDAGSQSWVIGNAVGDGSLRISASQTLGSADALIITPAGKVTFEGTAIHLGGVVFDSSALFALNLGSGGPFGASLFGGSIGWNISGGSGEMVFQDNYWPATVSFIWNQQTGAATNVNLMTLTPGGVLNVLGIGAGYQVNGVPIGPGLPPVVKVKTTLTARASNTTLSNDPDLAVTLGVAGTYQIDVVFNAWCVTAANGIAANINYTGSFTQNQSLFALVTPANALSVVGNAVISSAQTTTLIQSSSIQTTINAATGVATLRAVLVVVGAGTVGFAWAQTSSGVNPTNVGAGSYMVVTKIA